MVATLFTSNQTTEETHRSFSEFCPFQFFSISFIIFDSAFNVQWSFWNMLFMFVFRRVHKFRYFMLLILIKLTVQKHSPLYCCKCWKTFATLFFTDRFMLRMLFDSGCLCFFSLSLFLGLCLCNKAFSCNFVGWMRKKQTQQKRSDILESSDTLLWLLRRKKTIKHKKQHEESG